MPPEPAVRFPGVVMPPLLIATVSAVILPPAVIEPNARICPPTVIMPPAFKLCAVAFPPTLISVKALTAPLNRSPVKFNAPPLAAIVPFIKPEVVIECAVMLPAEIKSRPGPEPVKSMLGALMPPVPAVNETVAFRKSNVTTPGLVRLIVVPCAVSESRP